MRVTDICNRGHFDSVFIEGYTMPTYDNVGIEIRDGESLIESLNSVRTLGQGVCKMRLNVVGESGQLDKSLAQIGLIERSIGYKKRFAIGYVDIIILKDDCIFNPNVINKGNTEEDVTRVAKSDGELELMIKALEIRDNIRNENEFIVNCNMAIIDKIFVNNHFRRCGIATWIHNNIRDLIKLYGMMDIAAVLLIPGDFTKKAHEELGIKQEDYKRMLDDHYKTLGYKYITLSIMYKKLIKKPVKHMLGFEG